MAFLNLLPGVGSNVRSSRRAVCVNSGRVGAAGTIEEYFRDVARTTAPSYLETLLDVEEARGGKLVDPSDREDFHPFFIPMSVEGDNYTGFLRWPTPPAGMEVPIVEAKRGTLALKLLADSPEKHIRRFLAELNSASEKAPFNVPNNLTIPDNAVSELGMGLERFIVLKIGPFPDIYEGLARFHEIKGDYQSALVCAERAGTAFPGWGRGHAFHARLLVRGERMLEARDAARFSLQLPLWTLYDNLDEISALAGYEDPSSLEKIFARLASDERIEEITQGKPPEQVALDRAAYLLDYSFAKKSKDLMEMKKQLADLYEEGKVDDVSAFLRV